MGISPNSTVMRCFCWFFNPDAQSMPNSTTQLAARLLSRCGAGRAVPVAWLAGGTMPAEVAGAMTPCGSEARPPSRRGRRIRTLQAMSAVSAARFAWRTPRLAVWDARGTRPKARVAFLRERDWFVWLHGLSTRNDSWAGYRRPVRVPTSTLLPTVTCPSYLRVELRSAEPPPQHRFPSSRFKAEGRIQMLASCI